jgi:hypothetical protein
MFIVSKLFLFATLEFQFWLPGSMKKFRLSLSYLFACDFRRVAETVLQQIFFCENVKTKLSFEPLYNVTKTFISNHLCDIDLNIWVLFQLQLIKFY